MLVLSRKVNEVICIGDTIKITVISFKNGSVRLGIEAPRNIDIHREEIYLAMKEQKEKGDKS